MARVHRYHLDRDGHSVTVRPGHAARDIELLVDGKVVGYRRGSAKGPAVLAAELPGDPPRPFTVTIDPPSPSGSVPVCAMHIDGQVLRVPPVPPGPPASAQHAPRSADGPFGPVRWVRRLLRRRLRHGLHRL
ncbi:hypothetical protein [Streptomyces sp. PR69]|uniref:hypothetical protein n=1 Tax=Streptomyces sp. PR69 TaxID=2984950 RepID=UPI0022640AB9|nr:hypothetical protein [Streptomyces sp. PR69]